ncbi:hypothetical protein, partial [Phycicoccus avicenniae]|uniref:hypothetical protein n=1 Tax=Phycicoccus avicenniae TaxID=2828860 RepID=UPI003D2C7BBD
MTEHGSTPPPPDQPAPGSTPPPAPPADPYGSAPPPAAPNPYGSAPAYSQAPAAGPVTRPKSMDMAVLLMRVGAALSVLSIILSFATTGDIREQARQALEEQGQTVDPTVVDAAVTIGIVFGVVLGLLGAGLWLFMAWANGKGKSWARIVSTVLFAVSLVFFLIGLAQPTALLSRILSIVSILLGGYIVFLLWKKESSEFYKAA